MAARWPSRRNTERVDSARRAGPAPGGSAQIARRRANGDYLLAATRGSCESGRSGVDVSPKASTETL